MKARMRKSLAGLGLTLIAGYVGAALPEPITRDANDWKVQGQGEMRWFGLKLYEANLWSRGVVAAVDARLVFDRSFALELRYARNISAQALVQASMEEIQRLGKVDEQRLARWKIELERVFPNVQKNDVIVGVHLPARGADFYHQGKLTGRIEDAELARAFFSIWLDERTSEPALRTRLLGAS